MPLGLLERCGNASSISKKVWKCNYDFKKGVGLPLGFPEMCGNVSRISRKVWKCNYDFKKGVGLPLGFPEMRGNAVRVSRRLHICLLDLEKTVNSNADKESLGGIRFCLMCYSLSLSFHQIPLLFPRLFC